jgi:hypothetical protein
VVDVVVEVVVEVEEGVEIGVEVNEVIYVWWARVKTRVRYSRCGDNLPFSSSDYVLQSDSRKKKR